MGSFRCRTRASSSARSRAIRASRSSRCRQKLKQLQTIVQDDPAVASVVGFTGGRQTNSGFVYLSLKPFSERKITADEVVNRLRGKLATVAGARLYMVAVSDLRTGGRQSNATYQYTLLSDDTSELYKWAPKLTAALMDSDVIKDVNSDQQQGGLETDIAIDRDTAMRLGLTLNAIDNTLYDAFGQRQVSVIYSAQNQYHVVMEVAPRYWQDPRTLDELYVSTAGANPTGTQQTGIAAGLFSSTTGAASTAATIAADSARNLATNSLAASGHTSASSGAAVSTSLETMVPLSAFARFSPGHTPLSVNHQGLFAASTISFNLAPGRALSEAKTEIDNAIQRIGMPSTVRGAFAGTAATYQQSQSNMPMLFVAALLTIYIVLGILYESLIHPITILSTLFSASVGAALALWLFNTQFTVIAAIGVLLLIGIVKKNAIMMVDFALAAERQGLDTREAIEQACLLRFRPIMMTTCAAIFGALPLAFGTGRGFGVASPARHHHRRRLDRQSDPDALYDASGFHLPRLVWEVAGAAVESILFARPSGAACENAVASCARIPFAALATAAALAGCMPVGPDFVRPAAIVSPQYKEIAGWKIATPRANEPKGDWWSVFHDPELGSARARGGHFQPDGHRRRGQLPRGDRAHQ